jgi:hypothetical protein
VKLGISHCVAPQSFFEFYACQPRYPSLKGREGEDEEGLLQKTVFLLSAI